MKKNFKDISEIIEPDVISSNKVGNVTTYTHIINKLITYTDFDDKKLEIREKINEFIEKDIEEEIQEDSDETEGEITRHKHYIYKKITHVDKNGNSTETIDKDHPKETWCEIEENVHLPEESKLEIVGEEQIMTYYKYDQIKKTDRNNNITYGPKVLIETWTTKEAIEDAGSRQVGSGNCYTIEKLKRKKFTDRKGKTTYGEPYVVSSERVVTEENIETVYVGGGGSDCQIF